MPRLARKNIKVFAGNASNNGVFGSLQANNPTTSSDVEQLQSLPAWGDGWNSATQTSEKLPPLEEFQGIQYVTTYEQAYLMQEGIPEWSSSVTYYKGCIAKEVTSTGFKLYNSLTDNNTGNALSDTTNWALVMDSDGGYALDSTVVHKAGTETVTGEKSFTQNIVRSVATIGDTGSYPIQNTQLTKGTTPSTNTGAQFTLQDKNGLGGVNRLAGFALQYLANGHTRATLQAFKPTNGSSDNNYIYVDTDSSGNALTYAPACDANNSIVTTASKNTSGNGYVEFGNGLIIQWGSASVKGRTWTWINLNKNFASTNYKVFCTDAGASPSSATSDTGATAFKVASDSLRVNQFRVVADSNAASDLLFWFAVGF